MILNRISRCFRSKDCWILCVLSVCVFLIMVVVTFVIRTQRPPVSTGVLPESNGPYIVPWSQRFSTKVEAKNASEKRVNVIILTQMSSGSTFVGNMFNLHPDVFFLYEPFHHLRRRIYGNEWQLLEKARNDAYRIDFSNLLRDFFTCSFHENSTLSLVIPPWIRGLKDFMSWRFSSPEITNGGVGKACMKRRITVVKAMQSRLPREVGIQELQRVCRSDPDEFECFIIHLVRDPRAVLSSLLRRTFFMQGPKQRLLRPGKITSEGMKILRQNAHLLCSQVQDNLNYVKENWAGWFKGRYKLLRYEDFLDHIPKAVDDMYEFVGLSMVESMRKWILEGVQPLKSRRKSFIIGESGNNQTDYWRFVRDPSLVSLFEEVCEPLMKLTGYIPLHGSEQLQHDISKPLRTDSASFKLFQTNQP